jgi:hypothetical protein
VTLSLWCFLIRDSKNKNRKKKQESCFENFNMEIDVGGESNYDINGAIKQEPKSVSIIHVSYNFSSRNSTLVKLMIHTTLT